MVLGIQWLLFAATNRFLSCYCVIHSSLTQCQYVFDDDYSFLFCRFISFYWVFMVLCLLPTYWRSPWVQFNISQVYSLSLSPSFILSFLLSVLDEFTLTHTHAIIKMPLNRRHLIISYHTEKNVLQLRVTITMWTGIKFINTEAFECCFISSLMVFLNSLKNWKEKETKCERRSIYQCVTLKIEYTVATVHIWRMCLFVREHSFSRWRPG